jgi:hypothetical protein
MRPLIGGSVVTGRTASELAENECPNLNFLSCASALPIILVPIILLTFNFCQIRMRSVWVRLVPLSVSSGNSLFRIT